MLRTQTSPVQVREMQRSGPPIYLIAPGAVYRRDDVDATHSPMFHQMEGLAVDEGLTLAHLKGTMLHFFRELLGADREILLQPHFFPFTEPSVDVQVSYIDKAGRPSWLELAGAGMVDPNVLEAGGIDSERYTGFAFGCGLDRIAMIRFGVPGPAPVLRGRPALPGAVRVRVPLSWASDYVDPGLPAEELARALSGSGTLVEAIHHIGVPDDDGNLASFRVGRVLSAEPHPNADRLRVCEVDLGEGVPAGIVCGAPNVAAGQTVAVALPGALLPGADRPLKVAKLRGVESRGMILSATELAPGRRRRRDHGAARRHRPRDPAGGGAAPLRDGPGAGDHLQPARLPGGVGRGPRDPRGHRRAARPRSTSLSLRWRVRERSATTRRSRSTPRTCARATWRGC